MYCIIILLHMCIVSDGVNTDEIRILLNNIAQLNNTMCATIYFRLLGQILTLLALDVFGMLKEMALLHLKQTMPNIEINKFPFSSIARPTTGIRRTSVWGLRVRDNAV